MSPHPFLSPQWIAAAHTIREEYLDQLPPPQIPMRANVVITETPFESGEVLGFIDTTEGSTQLEVGHLDEPELTIRVDYTTAHALFITQDTQKLMEAFFGGRILVTGDVSKILSLTPPTDPAQVELGVEIARRLGEITAVDG